MAIKASFSPRMLRTTLAPSVRLPSRSAIVRAEPEQKPGQAINTPPPTEGAPSTPPPQPTPAPPAKSPSLAEAFYFSGPLPETANGRLAMLGFVAALGAELATGESVYKQFSEATVPVIGVVVAFTVATLIPIFKGSKKEAFGPFTPEAEQTNGRFAMIGLASLIVIELIQQRTLL